VADPEPRRLCLCSDLEKALAENARLQVTIQRLEGEARYLQALYQEEQAENDQWQKKLAEAWAELEQLRQHDKEAVDLTIDQQVEIGRLHTALRRAKCPE